MQLQIKGGSCEVASLVYSSLKEAKKIAKLAKIMILYDSKLLFTCSVGNNVLM